MLLTMASSSPPWTHSASKRLGPTGPLAVVVPWQEAQTSVNLAAIGLPRPPPRPDGAAPGPPRAGAPAGATGGTACPACKPLDAANTTLAATRSPVGLMITR